jgi:hypothetical protein
MAIWDDRLRLPQTRVTSFPPITQENPRIPAATGRRRAAPPGRLRKAVLAVAAVAVAVTGTVVGLTVTASRARVIPGCAVSPSSGLTYTLTPEQGQNATIIAAVAMKLGLPDHAVTVALATALQESELRDLPYGDQDSVGLFQQRPSQGWGTRTQILDPVYATTAFYSRLARTPGWTSMAVTQAAQAVQLSAAPSAYAQWEDEARALAVALTGEAPAAFSCRLTGFTGAAPGPTALATASLSEMGANLLDTPVGSKVGWAVAAWVVGHAWQYHVHRVDYGGWVWTSSSGRWTHAASGTGAGSGAATGDRVSYS